MNDPRPKTPPAGFVPYTGNAQLDSRLIAIEDALKSRGFERAIELANALLADFPQHAEAQRLLAAALRGAGRDEESLALLKELATREPDSALIQNSLGAGLRLVGEFEGARQAFTRAVELQPSLAPAWYNLAIVLFMLERLDEGVAAISRVLDIVPNHEAALIVRSDMMREQGHIRLVTTEYRSMLARNPRLSWAWFGLANLKNVKFSSEDLAAIRSALAAYPQESRERCTLHFALAKALDDNGLYEEAFVQLAAGNAGMRKLLKWDPAEFSASVDQTLALFTPPPRGSPTPQGSEVIFVASLPRSGSTLTEQILASHPQVEGAGEIADLFEVIEEESRRRGAPLVGWGRDATPEDWQRLGKEYLGRTAQRRQGKPKFVDKMLSNWRFAGAALAMLPEARMIICRRDPLEVSFSCYRQMFTNDGHGYCYDMADMATYWRDFDRCCKAWKALYPDRIHEMIYEELQADQEGKTRELLAFCGLEFDPACLRFHETERPIKTISAAQVREPLRRDTRQAPKYGALLDPLRVALGLAPVRAADSDAAA